MVSAMARQSGEFWGDVWRSQVMVRLCSRYMYMVPDLWSSKGESMASKVGFYRGNMLLWYPIVLQIFGWNSLSQCMSIYILTVWSLLLMRSTFVVKWYILQQKCRKKWIGSAILGTRRYNFQPPIPTSIATMHSITDRQMKKSSYWYRSEWVSRVWSPARYILGHFRDESLLAIACTDTDNSKQTGENTQKKQKMNKLALSK